MEAAEGVGWGGQVDFEDPVAGEAQVVGAAEGGGVAGGDVGVEVGGGDLVVGEFADEVAGVFAAQGPAGGTGEAVDLGVETGARDGGVGGEQAAAGVEDDGQVGGEPVLDGVVAEDVGAAQVGFEVLENGSEVGENDVVILDRAVRRVLLVGEEGVGARADDALVPVAGGAESSRNPGSASGRPSSSRPNLAFCTCGSRRVP
ncbi:hypothetical protein LO762_07635 [Actinocorallia sp. API 0066]|nr:hypothetical protein [Actinocorallia sp. API 0066]MCD0449059.1 hypothetical protein [Actinocorallia sp. API 0066]